MKIMKILKIEIVDGKSFQYRGTKLRTVKLTVKNFWGKKKEILASPTNVGPSYGGPHILWFYYTDTLGKKLEDEICEQINDFLIINS